MTQASIAAPSLIRPLVLIVDDDRAVLDALRTLLAPRLEPIYRVETTASAEEALDLVGAGQGDNTAAAPVALVISDEKMPGRSGTDLLIALRQHPAHRDGGRIIITAYAGLASAKKAINEAEVDRYYPKPWDAEGALLPAVGSVLARFARKRGLDRFLLAKVVEDAAGLKAVRAVRQAWWEYVNLMGETAAEAGVEMPSFDEPEDRDAAHILARRLSPAEDQPAGSLRLRRDAGSGQWIVDALAFLPEEANDDLESLLLRTTLQQAAANAIPSVRTAAPLLRRDVYERLGFVPLPATGGDQQTTGAILMAAPTAPAGAADRAFRDRYRATRDLCLCAQSDCPAHDYSAARRSYFCPLDVRAGRLPEGFPKGSGR